MLLASKHMLSCIEMAWHERQKAMHDHRCSWWLWVTLGWSCIFVTKVAYRLTLTDSVNLVLCSGMAQVSTGPAGGSDSAVLQDGAEVGGCVRTSLSGRERLHGGKDEGQTLCYVFVRGTGQSWRVACRGEKDKSVTHTILCRLNIPALVFLSQKYNPNLPSSSTAMTAAPLLSNTCTTVARPFLAAMWSGLHENKRSDYSALRTD